MTYEQAYLRIPAWQRNTLLWGSVAIYVAIVVFMIWSYFTWPVMGLRILIAVLLVLSVINSLLSIRYLRRDTVSKGLNFPGWKLVAYSLSEWKLIDMLSLGLYGGEGVYSFEIIAMDHIIKSNKQSAEVK